MTEHRTEDEKVYRCRWRYTPLPCETREGTVEVTARNLMDACERAKNKAMEVGMYENGMEILSAEIRGKKK
jgi:hypothetical protein